MDRPLPVQRSVKVDEKERSIFAEFHRPSCRETAGLTLSKPGGLRDLKESNIFLAVVFFKIILAPQ